MPKGRKGSGTSRKEASPGSKTGGRVSNRGGKKRAEGSPRKKSVSNNDGSTNSGTGGAPRTGKKQGVPENE